MAGSPQPNWPALERLKEELQREFRKQGVDHVEYVLAFSAPFDVWVWLGTATDAERDTLAADRALDDRVRAAADRCGLAEIVRGTAVESNETVDREYDGQWFYRLR
ncbi:hypothetical protein E0H75_24470 [Kribbella capetownensis]|uniref:Uncharacterized protein n=1 Tax=Kribbella capetownensis TaxID=1572659 RepID=A0A4R0JZL5_9ACTN|nr:hypothetical protein [Kribbella capetownensis]TCC47895.1 hypothetical protein E0H75_24470 [Kribbella capetownensis]